MVFVKWARGRLPARPGPDAEAGGHTPRWSRPPCRMQLWDDIPAETRAQWRTGQMSSPTSRPLAYAKDPVEHLTATWRRDLVRNKPSDATFLKGEIGWLVHTWAVARGMPTDGQVVGTIKHDAVRDTWGCYRTYGPAARVGGGLGSGWVTGSPAGAPASRSGIGPSGVGQRRTGRRRGRAGQAPTVPAARRASASNTAIPDWLSSTFARGTGSRQRAMYRCRSPLDAVSRSVGWSRQWRFGPSVRPGRGKCRP